MRSDQPNLQTTIALPKSIQENVQEVKGAEDTIYLCNFRVSVDGEWLCLKELQDLDIKEGAGGGNGGSNDLNNGTVANFGITQNDKCNAKLEREWVNYYCRWLFSFNYYFFFLVFVIIGDIYIGKAHERN